MRKRRTTEVDEVDDYFETLMRSGPFPGTDQHEVLCNAILDKINQYKAGNGGDEIDAELLEPELRTAIIAMVHGGRDPAHVPYRHIRHAIDNPLTFTVYKFKGKWVVQEVGTDIPNKMREGVKGPLRAVRSYCVGCMGGSPDLVRGCPSINCFLWPFRMATNPFYGRLKDSANDDENDDGFEGADLAAETEAEFEAEEAARFARMGAPNGNS